MSAKSPRYTVEALIRQKVLIPAGDGLFFVDLDANERWLRDQGKVAVGVIVGLVAVLGAVLAGLALVG